MVLFRILVFFPPANWSHGNWGVVFFIGWQGCTCKLREWKQQRKCNIWKFWTCWAWRWSYWTSDRHHHQQRRVYIQHALPPQPEADRDDRGQCWVPPWAGGELISDLRLPPWAGGECSYQTCAYRREQGVSVHIRPALTAVSRGWVFISDLRLPPWAGGECSYQTCAYRREQGVSVHIRHALTAMSRGWVHIGPALTAMSRGWVLISDLRLPPWAGGEFISDLRLPPWAGGKCSYQTCAYRREQGVSVHIRPALTAVSRGWVLISDLRLLPWAGGEC